MGSVSPFADDDPFEEKVKALADDELLEIWEQSQQIENLLNAQLPGNCVVSSDYEEAIVRELSVRACKLLCARHPAP